MKLNSLTRTFFWINSFQRRKVKEYFILEEEKERNKSAKRIRGINFENFKYADFFIANELWKKYITQLIEPKYHLQ
jgi:hypothetical protein